MRRHLSKDGTNLAYRCSGSGSHIIFVHGSATDGGRWAPVLPHFETRFTACVIDRRGHGESKDAISYSIESEFDDIASLSAALGVGPVDVVAHSYGALCALGAACRGAVIRRLVLYEPPLPIERGSYFPAGLTQAMREALERNDNEAAFVAYAADALTLSAPAIDAMRRLAPWATLVGQAARILRELESLERLTGRAASFRECTAPTLFLVGEDSLPRYRDSAEALSAVLPVSRIATLTNQGHVAIDTAPKLFADEVIDFLSAPMP